MDLTEGDVGGLVLYKQNGLISVRDFGGALTQAQC